MGRRRVRERAGDGKDFQNVVLREHYMSEFGLRRRNEKMGGGAALDISGIIQKATREAEEGKGYQRPTQPENLLGKLLLDIMVEVGTGKSDAE